MPKLRLITTCKNLLARRGLRCWLPRMFVGPPNVMSALVGFVEHIMNPHLNVRRSNRGVQTKRKNLLGSCIDIEQRGTVIS